MSMNFTVALSGTAVIEAQAEDLGIEGYEAARETLGFDVTIEDVEVSGEVRIEARISVEDVEVHVSDLVDFDADMALQEKVAPFGEADISDAEFEVTDSPTGFDVVSNAIGRDEAISAYAALDAAGYVVV